MRKTVFILSGPAGVGKTTLWHQVRDRLPDIEKVITTTSRPMREGELCGVDYHFLSREEFEAKIHAGEFLEYAIVHTNFYGSTFFELERILASDKCPLYIIEPQGMIHIKPLLEKVGYTVTTLFILPPSLNELKRRLAGRGTETEEQYNIRLATAISELEQQDFYDIKIINEDLEQTCNELIATFQKYAI